MSAYRAAVNMLKYVKSGIFFPLKYRHFFLEAGRRTRKNSLLFQNRKKPLWVQLKNLKKSSSSTWVCPQPSRRFSEGQAAPVQWEKHVDIQTPTGPQGTQLATAQLTQEALSRGGVPGCQYGGRCWREGKGAG